MSYNNSGRGSYNNGNSGRAENGRNGYYGGQNQQQNENSQDKSFGARFRVRGVVCTNKETGSGFYQFNMRSGSAGCSVNVMVKKFRNTGEKDRDGRTVWNEDVEYIRLIAFGRDANNIMSTVKAKSIMDFSGNISMRKREDGSYEPAFIVDKVEMVKEFTGSNSDGNRDGRGGYQRHERQPQNGGNSFNYDERPNNYSQREQRNDGGRENYRQNERSVAREDYAQPTVDNEDIPF